VVFDALVESLPTSRLLCLTTYRPEYQDRWGAKTYYSRLRLDPLPAEDTAELLNTLLGDAPALGALKTLLKERTDGNPVFVEECVRALAETGALQGQLGAYQLERDLRALQVPATVQALLAARIDRLPGEEKRLLQTVAVIGMDVPLDLLQQTVELTEEELRPALADLHRAEFLYEARLFPDTEYTFKHALTRDVAYGTLLQERRRSLHQRVGEQLEQRHAGDLSQFAEPLAGHFEQAEVWSTAARYWLMTAEKAKEHYNYTGGVQFCERALDLLDKGSDVEAMRLRGLVLLGDLWSLLGDVDRANESYDRGLALSMDPTERRRLANLRHQPHSIVRNGGTIVYYEHGGGDETLVLVTPLLYGLESYQPVIEQLCQEFRMITIDPRGGGWSDPLPGPYTEKDHVEDVRAVIECAADRPVVAVGNSRGGNRVVKLAAMYPALVKGLVLVGTHIDIGQSPPLFPGRESWGPRVAQEIRAGNMAGAMAIFASFVYSEPGTQDLAEQLVHQTLSIPSETILNFLAPDPEVNMFPHLPDVRVPTLVMRETADRMGSMEAAQYLAQQIKGAQFYAFEGRGHLPLHTATTEFCDILRYFVRTGSVPAAARSA
jgi:pimeloyl-ACP methyl ester carboxylesterase